MASERSRSRSRAPDGGGRQPPRSRRLRRRGLLKIGASGLCGLALPDLLRAEEAAGVGSSNKAVIHVHLDGGPPQMDLIDPKPDAPSEIRGEFGSIPTVLPGLHLSELMPKVASIADRFVFLRSLVGAAGRHDAFQCQSGFPMQSLEPIGGRPALGCVVDKLSGTPDDEAPVFVDLMQGRGLVRNSARPGFLGSTHKPFRPDLSEIFQRELEPGMQSELSRLGENGAGVKLSLHDGLPLERLNDRLGLLSSLDSLERNLDANGSIVAMDRFTERAVRILTSGRLADALNLDKEDPRVVKKFTPPISARGATTTCDLPEAGRKLLLARRLVEAGVRCVSVSLSDFDTHSGNFDRMRFLGPLMDYSLWALITDLEERGMLDDVTVLAWGEFGRTPKINSKGGRDHWPRVSMGLMAGGGMRVGQVIGSTDRLASEATSRPVHYQDVIATLYHNLGIDPRTTTIEDTTGRPQYLVEEGRVIAEVV